MLNSFQSSFGQFNLTLDKVFTRDLGSGMRNIRLEVEASEIRNVEKRYFINIEHKSAFLGVLTEGSLRKTRSFMNFKLTLIALFLQTLSLY